MLLPPVHAHQPLMGEQGVLTLGAPARISGSRRRCADAWSRAAFTLAAPPPWAARKRLDLGHEGRRQEGQPSGDGSSELLSRTMTEEARKRLSAPRASDELSRRKSTFRPGVAASGISARRGGACIQTRTSGGAPTYRFVRAWSRSGPSARAPQQVSRCERPGPQMQKIAVGMVSLRRHHVAPAVLPARERLPPLARRPRNHFQIVRRPTDPRRQGA